MCEAHIQDAPDDIPQSDSDVVTPEENKSKQETPPPEANRAVPERKLGAEVGKQAGKPTTWVQQSAYVRSTYSGCVR